MSIKIEISGSTPLEVMATLTAAGMYCGKIPEVQAAAGEMADAARADKAAPKSPQIPAKMTPAGSPPPAPDKNPASGNAAPAANTGSGQTRSIQAPVPPANSIPAPAPAPVPQAPSPVPQAPSPVPQAPAQQTMYPQTPPVPPQQGIPVAPAPGFTREQVAKAGADLVTANPALMGSLQQLLAQYGVKTLLEITNEQVGPIALTLRSMGARI